MRLLVYTALRLVMVLAAAGVLYVLGMRSWLLWVTAIVLGALVSFLVLKPQGQAAAQVISEYSPLREQRPTFSPRVEQDAAYEDALLDERADGPDEPGPEETGPGADPARGAAPAREGSPAEGSSLEREPDAEQQPVAQLEEPRVAQDHDEVAADGAPEHDAAQADRPRDEDQHQQRPR